MHGTVLCIFTHCAGAWSSKSSTNVCLAALHLSYAGLAEALSAGVSEWFCHWGSVTCPTAASTTLLSCPPKQDRLRWPASWHWSLASDNSGDMPKSCFRQCLLTYSKVMSRISFNVWGTDHCVLGPRNIPKNARYFPHWWIPSWDRICLDKDVLKVFKEY